MSKYGVCKALDGNIPQGSSTALVANPKCVCPNAMAPMFCPYGHMLECHYPMTCEEAQCEHFKREEESDNVPESDNL